MIFNQLYLKVKRKYWHLLVTTTRNTKIYPFIYNGYWHLQLYKNRLYNNSSPNYFTARPNPGAGIGHQMANWIAGYWFAKQFGLNFAHIKFTGKGWDDFLGFGEDEIQYDDLIKRAYKKVLLPLFDENSEKELKRTKDIIASYSTKKVVFVAEQDQGYAEQYGVMDDLKQKFYGANARKNDNLIYDTENYNVAIHVRRGDIVVGQTNMNPNLMMRWQNNDYFTTVLNNALKLIVTDKRIHIYLFSQGVENDFKEFNSFENLHFCLDMSPQDSFLHMVFADLLITSKSSFSYKPALLNNGIKICPKEFWHGYPKSSDWFLADEYGKIIEKNTFAKKEFSNINL